MEWLIPAVWACLGALLRALFGLDKAVREKRKILWKFFFLTLAEGIIAGVVVALVFDVTQPAGSLFVGYGGTDLLDALAKKAKLLPMKFGK